MFDLCRALGVPYLSDVSKPRDEDFLKEFVAADSFNHAADIASELETDPAGAGLLAIGLGGLDVEADDQRLLERASFVYDALYAWCRQQLGAAA